MIQMLLRSSKQDWNNKIVMPQTSIGQNIIVLDLAKCRRPRLGKIPPPLIIVLDLAKCRRPRLGKILYYPTAFGHPATVLTYDCRWGVLSKGSENHEKFFKMVAFGGPGGSWGGSWSQVGPIPAKVAKNSVRGPPRDPQIGTPNRAKNRSRAAKNGTRAP